MEVLPPMDHYVSRSNWFLWAPHFWTAEENNLFERALAALDLRCPDWEKVARAIPGRTVGEIVNHYASLEAFKCFQEQNAQAEEYALLHYPPPSEGDENGQHRDEGRDPEPELGGGRDPEPELGGGRDPRSHRQRCFLRCYNHVVDNLVKPIGSDFSAFTAHCTTPATQNQIKRQGKRWAKYSRKALEFEMAFVVYLDSAFSSTKNTTLTALAVAFLIIAIFVDLFACKLVPRWGHAWVHLSSFSMMLMTLFIFTSCHNLYGYAFLAVPVIVVAAVFSGRNNGALPDTQPKEIAEEEVDGMFALAAGVLSWEGFIAMVVTLVKSFETVVPTVVGFFFFVTVLVAIGVMVLTAVATDGALLRRAKLMDFVLRGLVVATAVATCVSVFTNRS